jgi:hypothetical protein
MTSANTHQYDLADNVHTRPKHVAITANPVDTNKQVMNCGCLLLDFYYSNDFLRSIFSKCLCCPHKQTNKKSSTAVPSVAANKLYTIFLLKSAAHSNTIRHSAFVKMRRVSHRQNQNFRHKRSSFFSKLEKKNQLLQKKFKYFSKKRNKKHKRDFLQGAE